MKNRIVNYRYQSNRGPSTTHEAPLWAFIFELGYFNAMNCGLIPPRVCLNSFLRSGASPEASWEPFEIDAEEFEALEAQLLKPDKAVLSRYSSHGWQTFARDDSLDQYTDLVQWQMKAREKHQLAWGQRMARLQHEMVLAANKS